METGKYTNVEITEVALKKKEAYMKYKLVGRCTN